jgi:hypothetical protein
MMLALALALAAAPHALPLMDETVTVPAADWRGFAIPLRQRPALMECSFSVASGGSGVRVMVLERAEFEQMHAGHGYRALAATAYQRSGGFAYAAPPGDYVVVVDNRMEGRGAAQVRLQVALVFAGGQTLPRTLSPERRAVVVGMSVLLFAAIALFAGSRLKRAFEAPSRGPQPPFPE